MNTEQTSREYLESLKKQIQNMDPLEKVCATVLVTLGRAVAELLNRRDYPTILEMKLVCDDLFEQARLAKDQASDIVQ